MHCVASTPLKDWVLKSDTILVVAVLSEATRLPSNTVMVSISRKNNQNLIRALKSALNISGTMDWLNVNKHF